MKRNRECCKHGSRCYRTSEVHRSELAHPGDDDYTIPVYEGSALNLPLCRFGTNCFRRNPVHFQQYSHPITVEETCTQESTVQSAESLQLEPKESQETMPLKPEESMQLKTMDSVMEVEITSTSDLQHPTVVEEVQVNPSQSEAPVSSQFTLIKNLQIGKGHTTIRCRVVIKSDPHVFTNHKGPGVMSTVDLLDESGEIRLSAFGPCVRMLRDLVEVDNVYDLSNFTVNRCEPKPGIVQVNPLQLEFNMNTKVMRAFGPSAAMLPELTFNFEPMANVDLKEKHSVMDVIAICKTIGPLQNVKLKKNVDGVKRELFLVDQSKEVMIAIWGTNAEKFERICESGSAIAFKRARVTDRAGKSLDSSCLSSSTFKVDPNILEAFTLRYWFESRHYSISCD